MSESNNSKKICTFYQRNACFKGDKCQFSHIGSKINENTSTSACGAKPKVNSTAGAKPKVESAGVAKPKGDSARCRYGIQCTNLSCTFGSHPPICLAGLNCQSIGTTCMCRHLLMCPYGNKCEKSDCTFTHGKKLM